MAVIGGTVIGLGTSPRWRHSPRSLLRDVTQAARAAQDRSRPHASIHNISQQLAAPRAMIPIMDGDRFDTLSVRIAAAYAAGDRRTAESLAREAVGDHAFPRVRKLATILVAAPDLREEVIAHALFRIAGAWSRGREVRWAEFESIVRGAVSDMHDKAKKHQRVAEPDFEDSGARDAWLNSNAVGESAQSPDHAESSGHDDRVLAIASELDELGRPQLAQLVRASIVGAESGPELGEQLGVAGGRVRQLRMELRSYLAARHPDLLSLLADPQGVDQ